MKRFTFLAVFGCVITVSLMATGSLSQAATYQFTYIGPGIDPKINNNGRVVAKFDGKPTPVVNATVVALNNNNEAAYFVGEVQAQLFKQHIDGGPVTTIASEIPSCCDWTYYRFSD